MIIRVLDSLLVLMVTTVLATHAVAVPTPRTSNVQPPKSKGAAVTAIHLPGGEEFDPALQKRLREASTAQTSKEKPRTKHINPDGTPQYINRLVFASSPYLQQHAFNPVNWYPWGEEAFAAAQRQNRPIFLSIGYSTCHWCHMMEEECFENEAIAQLLNEQFIAIKVDREERPDIDSVYVAAVQRMAGSAGWPLSVFLTPDRKPFYGGTYFPPEDRAGRPGFPKLLRTLADAWKTKHDEVVQASAALAQSLHPAAVASTLNLDVDALNKAYTQLRQMFDPDNGGFGGAPRFPQAHVLQFLLRYGLRTGNTDARRVVEETLQHMARGGIHDQLGGGFHRYSTDTRWFLPHFEKMLYDQAINARAYFEAVQAGGSRDHAVVAQDTFAYVLNDLTSPDGAFYTAEDADSDGEEGRFYTWSRAEIIAALGSEQGPLFADFFGLAEGRGLAPAGRSPLSIPTAADAFASEHHIEAETFHRQLGAARATLRAARNRRSRPLRDEKVITAWNGLMIGSLAYGSTVSGEARYAAAAARAADFVLGRMQRDGRLLRSYRDVPSAVLGYLDDYAFFIYGLTDLYAATFDVRWLREADRLSRDMLRLFADSTNGGLRYSATDAEQLIASGGDREDAALPMAESVAAYVLLRLGRLTMNQAFEVRGRAILAAHSTDLTSAPTAYTQMLMALDFSLGPTKEIVIAGMPEADGTKALLAEVRRAYLPRAVLALHPPNDGAVETLVPFLKEQVMINDKPTAYVCENYVCKLPTNDPAKVALLLNETLAPTPSTIPNP